MSLRETILAANDLHTKEVDLTAEWGCKVFVRVMTPDEYDLWIQRCREGGKHAMELMAVLVTVDEAGNKVFEPEDEATLSTKKGYPAIHKLWLEAGRLNGLLPTPKPEGAPVEAAA